jgi:hypothetical protein
VAVRGNVQQRTATRSPPAAAPLKKVPAVPYTVSQTSNCSRAHEVKCFATLPTLEEAFALKNGVQCRLAKSRSFCQNPRSNQDAQASEFVV